MIKVNQQILSLFERSPVITTHILQVNLTQNGRLETASTLNFTHLRGFQNLNLTLVRLRGLCLCSQATALGGSADLKQVARELYSLGLKLTSTHNFEGN